MINRGLAVISKTLYLSLLVLVGTGNDLCAQTLHLFSNELKENSPSVVYDFLERYLYQIDAISRQNQPINRRLSDDKVIFIAGGIEDVSNITPETIFQMKSYEDSHYEVMWNNPQGDTIVRLVFPMSFELLTGIPKSEVEKAMKSSIALVPEDRYKVHSVGDIVPVNDSIYISSPVSTYYMESVSDAAYFSKNSDEVAIPVFSKSNLSYSAANLFLGYVSYISDYRLMVDQNIYGFKHVSYMTSLSQWLAFCQENNCKLYFAVEEEREDGIKGLLIAHNSEMGYNHILSLLLPDTFTTDRRSIIKATMNAFIPTHNVKNLFQQYVDKPKKNI